MLTGPDGTMSNGFTPLVQNWWLMATRGILAILLGLVMALWRAPALEAVIIPFALYAFADGIVAIVSAFRAAGRRMEGWPIALEGGVSIVLGALALMWPLLPRQLIHVLVAWGILTGVFEIVAGFRLPRGLAAHWLIATGGFFSVFLALLVWALPRAASSRVALILSAYAFVFGVVIFIAALRFRRVFFARASPA